MPETDKVVRTLINDDRIDKLTKPDTVSKDSAINRDVAAPPLSLIERFSKDDTTSLTTPKRGKNDVEMP